MSIDWEEQYDKIYRYCYFRLHSREIAEDITQEAFLRYFENYRLSATGQALRCLYTIARNLCIDEYRRKHPDPLCEDTLQENMDEEQLLTGMAVRFALSELDGDDKELLLLRYVNGVSASVIGELLGISRFAVYRRLMAATKKFKECLRKEDVN